jgi:hypothetical protein
VVDEVCPGRQPLGLGSLLEGSKKRYFGARYQCGFGPGGSEVDVGFRVCMVPSIAAYIAVGIGNTLHVARMPGLVSALERAVTMSVVGGNVSNCVLN